MAKLTYIANVAHDGCIEDAHGGLDWTEPSDEAFTFITDLVCPVGTYLHGHGCTRRWPSGERRQPGRPVGAHGRPLRRRLGSRPEDVGYRYRART